MQQSRLIRALIVVAGLCSVSAPAFATAISTDTWYCGRFLETGTALVGGSLQARSVCETAGPISGRFGDPG